MIKLEDLLRDAQIKTEKMNKLRTEIVKEKINEEENEAQLWLTTPFKEKGLTNEKMRNAYVKQQMGLLYPSFYLQKKAELSNLEADLKWIYETLHIMKLFGVTEIDLEKKGKSYRK